ncbi:MAG: RsmE family RNA methyltransferase [Bdellovibrionales bacterium]|nr:RsmE family RNA methyltransferase [Bdellovibrionales bacterium]
MNRILIQESHRIGPNIYRLTNPSVLEHIHQVLGKSMGEELKCCLVNKGLFNGVIKDLKESELTVELLDEVASETTNIELFVGLSRPPTCQKILEHGTTLGVSSFHFTRTKLGEKSFIDSKLFKEKRYEKYLKLGLSQSDGFFQLPDFKLSSHWAPTDIEGEQKFVLDPFSSKTFSDVKINFKKKITLAIGPERGWHPQEVEEMVEHGFQGINLGPSKLRVELATYCALSQLELLRPKTY